MPDITLYAEEKIKRKLKISNKNDNTKKVRFETSDKNLINFRKFDMV